MRRKFDEQLALLNDNLLEMGALIERAIDRAAKALQRKDAELARAVYQNDRKINEKEREIETLCLKILLQQQPVAKDLRFVSTALKMITDMERIGDQAADISEIVEEFDHTAAFEIPAHIPQLADATKRMVSESIDAFVHKNLALAQAVVIHDDEVDGLFVKVRDEVLALIREDAGHGAAALDLLMIAKYFERIGDHAVNIAEWVMFTITGKHKGKQIL